MPFVTKLRLQSGDRETLESVVGDIKARAERKGVEFKGPHHKPTVEHRVPQHKGVHRSDSFAAWSYTVYTRTLEIVGHDEFARAVTEQSYPDSVYVSADIEQTREMDG